MCDVNYIYAGKYQHYLFWNFHTNQKGIIGIHSFGNKSIENVFGLFSLIIIFKMSLELLFFIQAPEQRRPAFFSGDQPILPSP